MKNFTRVLQPTDQSSLQNRRNFFCVFQANRDESKASASCVRGKPPLARNSRFALASPQIRKKLRLFFRLDIRLTRLITPSTDKHYLLHPRAFYSQMITSQFQKKKTLARLACLSLSNATRWRRVDTTLGVKRTGSLNLLSILHKNVSFFLNFFKVNTIDVYKITELLRALSLVDKCVQMRVCKHGCDLSDSRVF